MALVHLVIALALLEFFLFGWAVGHAREKYQVPAPAVSGNPTFERYFRAQMNTLEQLVIFVPSIQRKRPIDTMSVHDGMKGAACLVEATISEASSIDKFPWLITLVTKLTSNCNRRTLRLSS